MIHHRASLSKQFLAFLIFCHGTQTIHNSKLCHCLLFHEHVKQTSAKQWSSYQIIIITTCWQIAAIFLVKEATTATHTLGLNFILMSQISDAYNCWSCIALTWSKLNYRAWLVLCVSNLSSSLRVHSSYVWINSSRLHSRFLSSQPCALAVASPSLTAGWPGTIYSKTFSLHEIPWNQVNRCMHLIG